MSKIEDNYRKIYEILDSIKLISQENQKWIRFQGQQMARVVLIDLLKTDIEKLTYELSDGKTSREVGAIVGISHVTVINYWKKWFPYGIVTEKTSRGGGSRYVKIFSLSDFGIEIPKTPEINLQTKEKTENTISVIDNNNQIKPEGAS